MQIREDNFDIGVSHSEDGRYTGHNVNLFLAVLSWQEVINYN